jgi:hypothetical protein
MDNNHTDIQIPYPEAVERQLVIRVGACRLRITRGGRDFWVNGTYDDPTGTMQCRTIVDGGLARITQEPRLPALKRLSRGVPTFDLALGTAQSCALTIETGASDTTFEVGGVPLTALAIKLGAGKAVIRFLEPNPEPMSKLEINAGAGSLEIRMLANANFADLTLAGGAASFICDFGGTLKRDAAAHLSTGMSTMDLLVPGATAARIITDSTLGHVDVADGFVTREGGYWTAAAAEGVTPVLSIRAAVALGMLNLRSA